MCLVDSCSTNSILRETKYTTTKCLCSDLGGGGVTLATGIL
jgi:hypothetical protein